MINLRSVINHLKAQYAAEQRFGPASDLIYMPDDILMEECDAALIGSNNSYSVEDCLKEATRRGLISMPKKALVQPTFQVAVGQVPCCNS